MKVERLSKDRDAPPVWLWSSKTGVTPDDVDRFWQAFLRRFDLEHTFRFAQQTLGRTTPKHGHVPSRPLPSPLRLRRVPTRP
ncbi:hypothetical protein GCM10010343_29760 [Streptomyces avidinii]|nr:hypothetical protein GCM10010343_29760 [Streptomyces avidinii]